MHSKSQFQHSCINLITKLVFRLNKNVCIQSKLKFFVSFLGSKTQFYMNLDLVNLRQPVSLFFIHWLLTECLTNKDSDRRWLEPIRSPHRSYIYMVNNIYIYIPEDVVIWHAAVNLSLIDRYIQVHSLLVLEERARYANLDRKVTKKVSI